MLKALAIAAAVLAVSGASASADWQRKVETVGPNGGVWTKHNSGSCAGGTCRSHQTWTGPAGRTWSREGRTTCGGGRCDGRAVWTGPRGRTWERRRSFRRYWGSPPAPPYRRQTDGDGQGQRRLPPSHSI